LKIDFKFKIDNFKINILWLFNLVINWWF